MFARAQQSQTVLPRRREITGYDSHWEDSTRGKTLRYSSASGDGPQHPAPPCDPVTSELTPDPAGALWASLLVSWCIMYKYVLGHFSCVRLFITPLTVFCQAPLSMGFSKQEYWSGLSCPPPGDLPDPGIKPDSLKSPALASGFFTTITTWEAQNLT